MGSKAGLLVKDILGPRSLCQSIENRPKKLTVANDKIGHGSNFIKQGLVRSGSDLVLGHGAVQDGNKQLPIDAPNISFD